MRLVKDPFAEKLDTKRERLEFQGIFFFFASCVGAETRSDQSLHSKGAEVAIGGRNGAGPSCSNGQLLCAHDAELCLYS